MTYRYLPNFAARWLQLVFLVEGIVRGIMYLRQSPLDPVALTKLEQSAPLVIWGWLFLGCGMLGLFGEALMSGTAAAISAAYTPRAWPSFIAHAGLMVLYITLTLAYTAAIIELRLWHWAIVPYDLAALAFIHWLYARRRRGVPHVR